MLARFDDRPHSPRERFGGGSHSRKERRVCRVHLTSAEYAQQENSAVVESTRQPVRLSSALDHIAVRLSSAVDKRALRLSSALDKQCVGRDHSTSIAFVECTRQAVRLSSALDNECVCQVPSANIFWRTPNSADRHASVERYVFKVTYCVECSHADSNMCSRSTSKHLVLGEVPTST